MAEQLPHAFEQKNFEPDEHEAAPEALPPQAEQEIVKAETVDADRARHEAQARDKIKEIHKPKLETLDESARSASRIIRVPLASLEPVVETITKTLTSIRQNLSPSQKKFSKVIHNPVISNVSEFTAKTLARPYAILAGGVVAVIGSGVYLYYTRHLGYQYNYFVPILLFGAGLAAGIAVELFYKILSSGHKK